MRTFEIAILFLNLFALLTLYFPLRRFIKWVRFLPAVIVGLTIVHLTVEFYRWQMVPSYLLTASLFLLTLTKLLKGKNNSSTRGVWAFIVGGFAVL
jgi:hypothetical protein